MALVKCPGCTSQISDMAAKCPKCGLTIPSGFFENRESDLPEATSGSAAKVELQQAKNGDRQSPKHPGNRGAVYAIGKSIQQMSRGEWGKASSTLQLTTWAGRYLGFVIPFSPLILFLFPPRSTAEFGQAIIFVAFIGAICVPLAFWAAHSLVRSFGMNLKAKTFLGGCFEGFGLSMVFVVLSTLISFLKGSARPTPETVKQTPPSAKTPRTPSTSHETSQPKEVEDDTKGFYDAVAGIRPSIPTIAEVKGIGQSFETVNPLANYVGDWEIVAHANDRSMEFGTAKVVEIPDENAVLWRVYSSDGTLYAIELSMVYPKDGSFLHWATGVGVTANVANGEWSRSERQMKWNSIDDDGSGDTIVESFTDGRFSVIATRWRLGTEIKTDRFEFTRLPRAESALEKQQAFDEQLTRYLGRWNWKSTFSIEGNPAIENEGSLASLKLENEPTIVQLSFKDGKRLSEIRLMESQSRPARLVFFDKTGVKYDLVHQTNEENSSVVWEGRLDEGRIINFADTFSESKNYHRETRFGDESGRTSAQGSTDFNLVQ